MITNATGFYNTIVQNVLSLKVRETYYGKRTTEIICTLIGNRISDFMVESVTVSTCLRTRPREDGQMSIDNPQNVNTECGTEFRS
jgi:hypothetical protein